MYRVNAKRSQEKNDRIAVTSTLHQSHIAFIAKKITRMRGNFFISYRGSADTYRAIFAAAGNSFRRALASLPRSRIL